MEHQSDEEGEKDLNHSIVVVPDVPPPLGSSVSACEQEEKAKVCDGKLQGVAGCNQEPEKVSIGEALYSIRCVAVPFFREGGKRCWLLAAGNIFFLAAETSLVIKLTDIHKNIQNSLTDSDRDLFFNCVQSAGWWVVLLLFAVFLNMYFGGAFSLEWRKFLTDRLLRSYIGEGQAYYRLKVQRADIDNPDQRIGQDVGAFTGTVVFFFTQLARAAMTILSMSVVLFAISAKLFALLLVGSALLSAISAGLFGGPLMRLQRTILGREATLRFSLVRVREHAESIAFCRGANFERERCMDFFGQVIEVCYRRLLISTAFHGFQSVVTVTLQLTPWLMMAPEYFDGKATFGAIGQSAMLFNALMSSMTVLAAQLETVSNLGAQAVRVRQLQEGLLENKVLKGVRCAPKDEGGVDSEAPSPAAIKLEEMPPAPATDRAASPLARTCQVEASSTEDLGGSSGDSSDSNAFVGEDICLRLSDITLWPPRSQDPLVTGLSLVLREGQALMIVGPSGTGKSSLLRAISGLWATGRGTIERCHMRDCFFAPQVPYLCMGTLRENATYPLVAEFSPSTESDELIRRALNAASVGYLADRHGLDTAADWDDVLSGGEKQRLGFARLLLRKRVRLALLDEATSAMDPENEGMAYELLREYVPCFASVSHRPLLEKFHTHKLTLMPLKSGGCEGEVLQL